MEEKVLTNEQRMQIRSIGKLMNELSICIEDIIYDETLQQNCKVVYVGIGENATVAIETEQGKRYFRKRKEIYLSVVE